jgi:LmbE family N-acetylglucosaminyl deacetylase
MEGEMNFTMPGAGIFVPDGKPIDEALGRTTHLAVGAHPDDLEIMAYHGILQCFGRDDKWFAGVVLTNGSGSPRDDLYADYTDEDMQKVRRIEQRKAAVIGEYAAVVMLDYPSSAVKDPKNTDTIEDLRKVLSAARPEVVYAHNLADKHDTHVASALRTIEAIRMMPADARPRMLYGCEVWRDLDWMIDEDKVPFDVGAHPNLSAALLGVYDSQICGGKRYDLATIGRRTANATYFASHGVDVTTQMTFAMDLTPLIADDSVSVGEFVADRIRRFADEVAARLAKLT